MMAAKHHPPRTGRSGGRHSADGRSGDLDDNREHITATDRWLFISKRVYNKAQRRGFVGGDPFADLSEAIREIDAEYVTDLPGLLALTDPKEMMNQLRNLFAGYGLNKQSLDRVLEMNRDAIEKLARINRSPKHAEAHQAAQRKSLLKNTTNQAVKALQSLTHQVEDRTRSIPLLGESTQAAQSILTNLRKLASSAGDIVRPAGAGTGKPRSGRRKRELEVHAMVVKAYDGLTPLELADAPIAALRGISEASSRKLKSAFGMNSIRDMATSRIFDQADGVVTLAEAEQRGDGEKTSSLQATALQALADGPVNRLEGVTPHQARVLQHTLKIDSIRDLSTNRFFRIARAIVSLADAPQQKNG